MSLANLKEKLDGDLELYGQLMVDEIKKSLLVNYPYAPGYFGQRPKTGIRNMTRKTGNLYKSIKVSFNPSTNQMKVNMLNYWRFVNDGRQPGKYVPLKPLMDWMKIKGMNRDTKGRFKKFNLKSTAFAISTSIKKFGIQPTNFYDDSFDVFIKAFDDPNGPASKLGIDLQNFLINIIQEPVE